MMLMMRWLLLSCCLSAEREDRRGLTVHSGVATLHFTTHCCCCQPQPQRTGKLWGYKVAAVVEVVEVVSLTPPPPPPPTPRSSRNPA